MVPKEADQPDVTTIYSHLRHITRRWGELSEPAQLEIVYLSAENRAQVKHTNRYDTDDESIQEAATDVAAMNSYGINAYATVNPVDANARLRSPRRASREHILASFFHFADGDTAEAADNIREFVGPKPTFVVLTGTKPHLRPHVYWELEYPVRNLDAWERTQRSIAATLKTDPAVVDAPRIMRIGGTINWPKPQKIERGYIAEIVTIHIHDPDERPAIPPEQMERAFGGAAQTAPAGGLQIDTGGHDRKSADDYADILRRARTDGEKHGGVRDLTASLAGSGVPRALAEAIVREACPVWDANVENLIDSAYQKYWQPGGAQPEAPQFSTLSDEEKAEIKPLAFEFWDHVDLATIPHPEFVYSDFYARGYTSVTVAPPKAGKSMLGLAEAVDMATGKGILTNAEREPLRVLYYNAEDDINVIRERTSALLTCYGIKQDEIRNQLMPISGVEAHDFYLVSGQEGAINENLFLRIERLIETHKLDVLIFDPLQDLSRSPETNEVFRLLGQRLRRMASEHRVAIGLIHHTRKLAPDQKPTMDDARGGGALRGTSRFNRLLVSMTEDEAAQAGIDDHRYYVRIGDVESNLAPPSSSANRWFEKVSILTPNGHEVGAVKPWEWPDLFTGFTVAHLIGVQREVQARCDAGLPPRLSDKAGDAWVGNLIAETLGLDAEGDRPRIRKMLAAWIKSGALKRSEMVDETRRKRPCVEVGEWATE